MFRHLSTRVAFVFRLLVAVGVIAVLVVVPCALLEYAGVSSWLCRILTGLLGALIGFGLVALLAWALRCRLIPWGDLFMTGRQFQAHSLADVPMYLSAGAQRKIFDTVLKAVENDEELQQAFRRRENGGEKVSIVLCGHSWGTVINYDVLLGTAHMGASTTDRPSSFN